MTATRLEAAARRALESIDDLIANTTDPGVEALGARHELSVALIAAPAASPSAPADRAAILREAADRLDARAAVIADVSDDPAIFVAKDRWKVAGVWRDAATELRRMADVPATAPSRVADEAQPLRAELKPWQLLAGHDEGPVPQTERLIGGRRLTRGEAQQDETQAERRETVLHFLQTQQPDGTWVDSSSVIDDPEYALVRLAQRQERVPHAAHRIARHTTTVVVEPIEPAVVSQPGKEA